MSGRRPGAALGMIAFCWLVFVWPGGTRAEIGDRIKISGDVRTRWLQVDVDGPAISGLYGESLEPQTSLFHRLFLEVEGEVTKSITAGGLLRVSNEPESVLRLGPDYFSRPEGSAFVALRWRWLRARGGYYSAHLTPLTLMRWDLDDIALGGSARAGCACGGALAATIVESFEEPAPDLRFEGMRADGAVGESVDWSLLYARPREPVLEWELVTPPLFEPTTFQYHQDLYAGRVVLSRFHEPTMTFWRVGATVIHVRDDPGNRNPGCPAAEDFPLCFAMENTAFGLDAHLPIGHLSLFDRLILDRIIFEGEWLRNAHREDRRSPGTESLWANGVRATLGFELLSRKLSVESAYLRLEDGFISPYSAVTYGGNRAGHRHRVRAELGPVTTEGFLRWLAPVDDEWVRVGVVEQYEITRELTASLQASAAVYKDWRVLAGLQMERRSVDPKPAYEDDYRDGNRSIGLAELSYALRACRFSLVHQAIREESPDRDSEVSDATITSLTARANF